MVRPDGIPEEIWKIATRLAEDCAFEGHKVRSYTDVTDIWAMSDEGSAADFARALLAERDAQRERDALKADEEHKECTYTGDWNDGYRAACENIAGAIRKGPP